VGLYPYYLVLVRQLRLQGGFLRELVAEFHARGFDLPAQFPDARVDVRLDPVAGIGIGAPVLLEFVLGIGERRPPGFRVPSSPGFR
jgi:hypothetical protein